MSTQPISLSPAQRALVSGVLLEYLSFQAGGSPPLKVNSQTRSAIETARRAIEPWPEGKNWETGRYLNDNADELHEAAAALVDPDEYDDEAYDDDDAEYDEDLF